MPKIEISFDVIAFIKPLYKKTSVHVRSVYTRNKTLMTCTYWHYNYNYNYILKHSYTTSKAVPIALCGEKGVTTCKSTI